MSDYANSFPPIEGTQVHTLILGTMPGQASLQAQEYYAHPRNALWPILLAHLTKTPVSYDVISKLTYAQRCELAVEHGIAIWDVLASCARPGSLDSNIVRKSEVPNDIACLVKRHTELERIICNGRTAQALFKRHIQGTLPRASIMLDKSIDRVNKSQIRIITLPSTSPAMASLTLTDKYQLWAEGLLG